MSEVSRLVETGLKWMPLAPSHWTVVPAKVAVRAVSGSGAIKNTLHDLPGEGRFPAFSASGQDVWSDTHDFDAEGIVLSAVGARCGKAFKADGRWSAAANTHVLMPEPGFSRDYLWYLMNDERFWEKGGTAQPFIKVRETLDRRLMFPPLTEQLAIASYLDAETARIDGLIAAKRELLLSLNELKATRITEILTGAGDAVVPTGDVWLPMIPAGWALKRLKHIGQVRSGLAKGKKHDTGTDTVELPYMRVANVQDGHIDLTDVAVLEVAVDDIDRYSLAVGDVLMNEGGDYDKLGRGAVWEGQIAQCLHQNHVFAVRLDDVSWAPWVSALTRTAYAKFYFMNNSKQSTNLASISQSNVKEWPVILPPLEVRDQLLEQLTSELKRADDLVAHVELELATLKELRSSTITDAVLGRIDVREHMKH